ncbi:MAG: LysR family transcriptional regulator [Paludibacteraceae bacterium]|nr:LysR family transcriptional regulator [Paludibacteraceae bacterium]
MELKQLRAFVKAAQLQNFSEAAKALCINQSSFSQNIKQLEEELNVTLFHRNTHETTLTQAGKELLPFAQQALQKADNCVNRMNDLLEMRCGTLNIGVTHSFSLVLTESLQTFLKAYPGIKVNIYYKTMSELMDMLLKREVDFVLSYRPEDKAYPQVVSHTLFEDHLSVIVRKDHPLAKKQRVSIKEISEYPLALPSIGLHARDVLDRITANAQVELNARVQLDQVAPLLELVRKGMLITVLSGTTAENEHDLVAIPIDADGTRMEGSCQMLKEDYRKEAAKEFFRIMTENNIMRNKMAEWLK